MKICTQCGTEYDLNQKFCPLDGSPLRLQSADDPLIGQMVADRYQILSLIGEGGMGRVYLAEHVRMGRKSAVKVINPALATTADAISRFNREASNACKINHPNVAQVYDFGEMADGTLYLAMEYIDGETLDAIVAREGPLPPVRAAHITKQVADALYAAHHLGIVHRDLKPENVMIARHLDGSDWVKVVDFGIAKTIQRDGSGSQTVTTAGVSLGTPEYMSPEQLAGEKLDHRTDIYSLGLVLFNMLTGELPYPKLTSKETLVRRLTSPPKSLAEVRPQTSWPASLQTALNRALTPDVADRFDNVADFGRAVVRAVETVDADAPAAAASIVSAPLATATLPNVTTPAGPPAERPIAHRRALPWVIGTVAVLGAAVIVTSMRARHQQGEEQADSAIATATATVDTASFAAIPAPAPKPFPARSDTISHRLPAIPPKPPLPSTKGSRVVVAGPDFGERISDSIQRIVRGMPFGDMVRIDSLLARIGPEIERARRAEQSRASRLPLRHYWLAPSGDSIDAEPLPPDAPLEARSAAAYNEIRGHIARMQHRFISGDTRGTREEFTRATSELSMLREIDPDPRQAAGLQRELSDGVRNILVMCYRMRADSTLAAGVRCENFLGLPARIRGFRQPD